jgi:acyl-CoA reductase-like NAD-dependent aldehyde dehydrogenase
MSEEVQRVLDAAVEGQARSPRHIQYQLSKLHQSLVKDGSAIRDAIKSDTGNSTSEIEIQYALTLEATAKCFTDSNFEQALKAEFSLSRGENAPSNLVPYPLAYIVPSTYNLVYSSTTAVATAISAGCCVILEVTRRP